METYQEFNRGYNEGFSDGRKNGIVIGSTIVLLVEGIFGFVTVLKMMWQ